MGWFLAAPLRVFRGMARTMSRRGKTNSHVSTTVYRLNFVLPQKETSPVPPHCPNTKVKEILVLISPPSRAILGSLDILVDIGVPAEKEVIQ
jgi:hypothetical protein